MRLQTYDGLLSGIETIILTALNYDKQNPGVNKGKHDQIIAKGALVNVLGIAGKVMIPVFFILSTRLFGTTVMGVFYLAFTMIEVATSLVSSGFTTGTMMFVSRYQGDDSKQDILYRSLVNGFALSIGVSLLIIIVSRFGGPELLLSKYPQAHLLETVQNMALALPFIVITAIIIAGTKAHLTMKWDAILMGFARPILLILFSLGFHFCGFGLTGLIWGYVITQSILAVAALLIFHQYFSYKQLFTHVRRFKLFPPLLKFAIPQNLNMTFNTLITNLDVLMLGYFGYSESVLLFYGMGAQLVRNIRQVKLAISGSFAPVIARLHEQGSLSEMSKTFSMVTRWITTIGFPLAVVVAILRLDLLRLFDSSFSGDTTFMLLLLVPPLMSCGFGLAGNIVAMTGHSAWNLVNSLTVAGINGVLNYFLIPKFGILGAATATVIASVTISIIQLIEAKFLVGAALVPSQIYKPYLAILPSVVIVVLYSWLFTSADVLPLRIGVSILCVGIFVMMLFLLGIDPQDRTALDPRTGSKPSFSQGHRK